uniref:Uncharacterized protein n=1 Tax=uncultured Thiotrichaceae bacterium TaxID=298394 RepID=A0A6S6SN49_9GAMM|nr:MAG: Unknown protein [uncultured Thiotrichaceae bacterium]
MAEKAATWVLFLGFVCLFLFSFWAAQAYFADPAAIPMKLAVMALIALLVIIGAALFLMNAETKRKLARIKALRGR